LLTHLGELGAASAAAMSSVAAHYERSDLAAESKIDASYPEVPRAPMARDVLEGRTDLRTVARNSATDRDERR
jgi:hypothetical protein